MVFLAFGGLESEKDMKNLLTVTCDLHMKREQRRMSASVQSEQEALSRNTYKLAQLASGCSVFIRQCHLMFSVRLAGEGSAET